MSTLEQLTRLADQRKAASLTQNQIAGLVGTSQANIVRLEHAGKTISVEQVEEWLRACGFPTLPNVAYLTALDAWSQDRSEGFLLGADAILRANGAATGWHRKPLLAVVPNGFGDARISVAILRDLFNGGDQPFCGLLMPNSGLSILFKHISERPTGTEHTAYRLAQNLPRSAFSAPLDGQMVARSSEAEALEGGLIVLESGSDAAAVVYLDHPILRVADVFRPGFDFDSGQALLDLEAALHADVLLLCCGQRAIPSVLTMVLARLATNSVSFIACPATVDLQQIHIEVQRAGSELAKLSLDARLSLDYNNSQALQALVTALVAANQATCQSNRELLDREAMHQPVVLPQLVPRVPDSQGSGLGEMLDEQFAYALQAKDPNALLSTAFDIIAAFEEASKPGLILDLPRGKYEDVFRRRRRKDLQEYIGGLQASNSSMPSPSDSLVRALYSTWVAAKL